MTLLSAPARRSRGRGPVLFKGGAAVATERHHKAIAQVLFKAEGEDDGSGSTLQPGEFIASAAVFGNVDSYGDRIVKGAFADTLAEWNAKGDPIPVIWQHNWGDPEAHIGEVLQIMETDEALVYKGRIDLDEPFAAKVYRLMKARRITQQSFGYDVLDAREITEDGERVFELLKVHLYEVGPCLVGVNQATNLLDIKSGGGAASAAPEPSGQATPPAAGDSGSSATPPGSTQEPPASKGLGPASVMLALEISEMEMETPDV